MRFCLCTNLPSMIITLNSRRRVRYLGHATRIDGRWTPRHVVFNGRKKTIWHTSTEYRDICKSSLRDFSLSYEVWKGRATDRIMSRVQQYLRKRKDQNWICMSKEKRTFHRKHRLLFLCPGLKGQHWQSQPGEELLIKMIMDKIHKSWLSAWLRQFL